MLPTFINSVEIDLKTKIEYMYTKKAIILHENDRLFIFYTRHCLGWKSPVLTIIHLN